jgi:hypothetical protein
MDPALVRGKKFKSDSDNEEPANQYEEEYKSSLTKIPALTPIIQSNSPKDSQESLLKFRAEVLKYQGMCLQYQASLLEKQAKTMGNTQQETFYQDTLRYSSKMRDQEPKYFHKISLEESKYTPNLDLTKAEPKAELNYEPKAELKYEPKELKYRSPTVDYSKNGYEPRYNQYETDRYPAKAYSPVFSSHLEDKKFLSCGYQNVLHRHAGYNERERSPLRASKDLYQNRPTYGDHDMYNNPPVETPNPTLERHLYDQPEYEVPLAKEDDRRLSPGPMDLSVKKSPSPLLHTQVQNMPRIFFRLEQNRI